MSVVLTWNVAGRVRAVGDQARALAGGDWDVVALQEVRASALGAWQEALAGLGLPHVVATRPPGDAPERRLGVLVASRTPVELVPAAAVPWPERYLVARTELAGTPAELHNLHAPISARAGRVKVRTLEAVYAALAGDCDVPRVLVGDLNTPQYESREGEVHTFARTRSGRIRPDYGERHDLAELALIVALQAHGYVDAFRHLHGYARRDRSWRSPHLGPGYRLDHVIVRGLRVAACEYEHAWRDAGLSDHAGMWARLSAGQA